MGTVNYVGKAVSLKVVKFDRTTEAYKSDFENAKEFEKTITEGGGSSSLDSRKGGEYGTASVGEELFAGSSVVARYRVAGRAVRLQENSRFVREAGRWYYLDAAGQ